MGGNGGVGCHGDGGEGERAKPKRSCPLLLPWHGSVLGIFAEKVTLGNTQLCGCSICRRVGRDV